MLLVPSFTVVIVTQFWRKIINYFHMDKRFNLIIWGFEIVTLFSVIWWNSSIKKSQFLAFSLESYTSSIRYFWTWILIFSVWFVNNNDLAWSWKSLVKRITGLLEKLTIQRKLGHFSNKKEFQFNWPTLMSNWLQFCQTESPSIQELHVWYDS